MINFILNWIKGFIKKDEWPTSEIKNLDVVHLSLQSIKDLEKEALLELRERWGPDRIYEVKIDIHGFIHITVSEFMFFAWDEGEDWEDEEWGTAKSNLEDEFEKNSKFHGCVSDFGYNREAEVKYFNTVVK